VCIVCTQCTARFLWRLFFFKAAHINAASTSYVYFVLVLEKQQKQTKFTQDVLTALI
jgi:hypothetical protein